MIDKQRISDLLLENRDRLLSKYQLTSIGIFGSFSRDDFSEMSDIDILVDYTKPIGIEFIDLADELEQILNCKVDLVSKKGIKPKYFREIQKDLIYV